MFRTLQSKLMFFFLVLSLSGIIFVSMAIQLGFFGSFREYLDTKRLEQVEIVVDRLEQEHRIFGTVTGETITQLLHHYAMTDHLFFTFYDQEGNVVFDSMIHFEMMKGMMTHDQMSKPNVEKLSSDRYSVTMNNGEQGYLIVNYPQEYVDIDTQFLQQFNKYIIFTSIIMIVISITISYFISKKMTRGLRQVSNATRELQKNNLKIRVSSINQVEEIQQLANSFNELAESLSNHEKLRKQFTNDLAHELRTPLATLRSQIEAFLDGVWEPTPERLKQSHRELMRLVRLVDDLEKLLAAENPQIQLLPSELNVQDVQQSLKASFQPLFDQKGIELSIEEPKTKLTFWADRDRFFQIMVNLLNNALKYTNEGGKVTVKSHEEKQSVCFMIEDNGQGISEADLQHIFERFYRGEKSRNRKTGGVGIGLSIVKALVEAHKGKITIESEKNKGTKVKVRFRKPE